MSEIVRQSQRQGIAGGPAARLDRWADALTGPRRHRAIGLALVGYILIWTAFRILATLPRDIHFDMSEVYAWSRALALGYDKHPPLSALVVHVWFWAFPVTDWAFTLLAAVNIGVTLYVVWLILDRWTDPTKAAFGVAVLTLAPFYNFLSLKYNANTVLLPVWAFTAYAFLRAFQSRSALWSLLAGAAAGAAMLGKYWSIFLIAGLLLATLIDPRRRSFFLSPAPYLMALAGAVAIAPHVHWLVYGEGMAFGYASKRFEGESSALQTFTYLAGLVGYMAAPVVLWALLLRPRAEAIRDVADPDDPQRTLMVLCFVLPNILPLLASPWITGLTALWALPGFSLLPLVLLASPLIVVTRHAFRWMLAIAALASLVALLAAPLIAVGNHARSNPRPTDYGSLLARDVARLWQTTTPTRLRVITGCGGEADPAQAVAFALKLPMRTLFSRQGMGARTEILTRGGFLVSAADYEDCRQQGEAFRAMRPQTQRFFLTYQPTLFGIAGKPFSYVAYLVPPP